MKLVPALFVLVAICSIIYADEVIVYADRITPDIIAIERDEWLKEGKTDLIDILRDENIYVNSLNGNSSNISLDLGSYGNQGQQRSYVSLDGRGLNPLDIAGLNYQALSSNVIQSIRLYSSPSTAEFGNNASGGALTLNTENTQDYTSFSIGGGSFNTITGLAGIRKTLQNTSDSFSILEDVTFQASSGTTTSEGFRDNSASEVTNYTFELSANIDWVNLSIGWNRSDQHYEFPGPLTQEEFENDPTQAAASNLASESTTDEEIMSFELEANPADYISLNHSSYFTDNDTNWRITSLETDPFNLRLLDRSEFHSWVSLNLPQDTRFELGHNLAKDSLEFIRAPIFANESPSFLDRELSEWYLKAYWEPKIFETENTFHAIWRQADYSLDFEIADNSLPFPLPPDEGIIEDSEYAWSIGWHSQIRENWNLQIKADRFYRFAATDEIFGYQGVTLTPNPTIAPEYGHSLFLSAGYENDLHKVQFSYLRADTEDAIYFNSDPAVNANLNIGDLRRERFQLQYRLKLEYLTLDLQHQWLIHEFTSGIAEGRNTPLTPQQSSTLSLEGSIKEVNWNLTGRYLGTIEADNGFNNDPTTFGNQVTWDASLSYSFLDHASASIRVSNIFDINYIDSSFFGGFYPAQGRSIQLGLNYEY